MDNVRAMHSLGLESSISHSIRDVYRHGLEMEFLDGNYGGLKGIQVSSTLRGDAVQRHAEFNANISTFTDVVSHFFPHVTLNSSQIQANSTLRRSPSFGFRKQIQSGRESFAVYYNAEGDTPEGFHRIQVDITGHVPMRFFTNVTSFPTSGAYAFNISLNDLDFTGFPGFFQPEEPHEFADISFDDSLSTSQWRVFNQDFTQAYLEFTLDQEKLIIASLNNSYDFNVTVTILAEPGSFKPYYYITPEALFFTSYDGFLESRKRVIFS